MEQANFTSKGKRNFWLDVFIKSSALVGCFIKAAIDFWIIKIDYCEITAKLSIHNLFI